MLTSNVAESRRVFAKALRNPFLIATYLLMTIAAAVMTFQFQPQLVLPIAATLCGWSETNGLCGTAHVCTLTPVRTFHPGTWFKAASAYTVGGIVSASVVGGLMGVIGRSLGANSDFAFLAIIAMSLLLAARELQWVSYSLPQVRRQTNKFWAFEFGIVPAAWMWGTHIGLGFATVIRHGGIFVLSAFSLTLGPSDGAIIMAAYWIGRALPVWIAGILLPACNDGALLSKMVAAPERAYRHAAAAGMLCAFAVAIALVSL
jgi:hypothetical protein